LKNQNWVARVQDRGKWKQFVEKAKTFNERKFSAWKKNRSDNSYNASSVTAWVVRMRGARYSGKKSLLF
jgi:hypothetical protein